METEILNNHLTTQKTLAILSFVKNKSDDGDSTFFSKAKASRRWWKTGVSRKLQKITPKPRTESKKLKKV